MSYDLGAYQEAMRVGHAFAWDLKWEAASRQYRIALGERPGDPSATLSLARALERMGDLKAALDMYEEAHRLLPDHAPVLVSLVELQQRLGDLSSAATSFVRLAALCLDQGQPGRAEEMLRHLDDLPAPDGQALRHLADVAGRVGSEAVLAVAREKLAALPVEDGPSAEAVAAPTPATAENPASEWESLPLDLPDDLPEPVQALVAALAARERTGHPGDDELSRMASGWCPLPAELLKVPPTERASLAVALYEVTEDISARRLDAAFDACWGAIGQVADYLPAQVQLARVDVAAGETTAAEWRLKSVAELYEGLEQYRQAAETWDELGLLILGPDAVEERILDLLIRHGAPSEAVAVLAEAATRRIAAGRLDDAVRYLERTLEITPEATELGLWRARLLVELGRADDAARWVERSLESAAALPALVDRRLLVARGVLAARAGRWADVESVFERWREDPRDDGAAVLTEAAAWGVLQGGGDALWYVAGQVLAATGAVDEADSCYRRALVVSVTPVTAVRFALGRLAAERGDWPTAARWLTECLDGLSPAADFARGDQLLRFLLHVAEHLRDDSLRVRALGELVQLHPDDPELYPQLAECLSSLGDTGGAREQFHQLADLFERRGEPVRALAAEQAAASLRPLDPASQRRLGDCCLRLDLRDDAIAALEAVVDLEAASGVSKLSSEALRTLIDLTRLTEPRRATAYRERLVRVSPSDWEARQVLARNYLQDGRMRRALAVLRDLAALHSAAGRWPEAAAAFGEALRLDPWNPRLVADAARALVRSGDRDGAASLVERLRRRDPEDPVSGRLSTELGLRGDER